MTTMITRVSPTRSEAARDRKAPTPHGQALTAPVDPAIAELAAEHLRASIKAGQSAAATFAREKKQSLRRQRRRGEIATDAQLAIARTELDRLSEAARLRIRGKAARAANLNSKRETDNA